MTEQILSPRHDDLKPAYCGFQLGMVPVLETSGYQRSGCDVNRWQVLRADQKAAS